MPRMIGSGLGRGNREVGLLVSKIDTTMDHKNASQLARRYGVRGPLPKGLPREEKMRAYEARYITAGGPKGERYSRRSERLDRVTGASLGVGGAAAAGELASRTRAGQSAMRRAKIPPRPLGHKAGVVGLGAAAVGSLSELARRHADHRRAHYASSPAGVAASALRRMRDYTPED